MGVRAAWVWHGRRKGLILAPRATRYQVPQHGQPEHHSDVLVSGSLLARSFGTYGGRSAPYVPQVAMLYDFVKNTAYYHLSFPLPQPNKQV